MAIRDIFKINRKTFINPRAWLGYDSLKEQNRSLFGILKNLFITPTPKRKETFAEAVARFNLSEEDLKEAETNYRFFSIIFLIFGIIVFGLGLMVLFRHHSFAGFILATSASALFLANGFKFNFWAFQIQKRKLGCTFEEWRNRRVRN